MNQPIYDGIGIPSVVFGPAGQSVTIEMSQIHAHFH